MPSFRRAVGRSYAVIMFSTAREPIAAVSLDAGPQWSVERQIMLRIEYVVNQVACTHAGAAQADVARTITERLRGLGVTVKPRQIQQYVEAIARLPQQPPPPRDQQERRQEPTPRGFA